MGRGTLAAIVLVSAALVGVVAVSLKLAERDREAFENHFAAERSRQVQEAAVAIAADLKDIRDDLAVAAQLVQHSESSGEQRRSLGALLAVVKQYRVLEVFTHEGVRQLSVSDPLAAGGFLAWPFEESMAETARRATGALFGEVVTSPPLPEDGTGWMRAFGTPVPPSSELPQGGAVVLLVDTEPYFSRLSFLGGGASSRLLLLGAHGRPTPATSPDLARAVARADSSDPALPGFRELVGRMRSGERGTARLSPEEAQQLGLERAAAVAAFAPTSMEGGGRWGLATLTSVSELVSDERSGATRLLMTSGAIAALLVAFGAYLVFHARREVATRERLRHAERVAHLHEKTEKILDHVPAAVLAVAEDGLVSSDNRALRERTGGPAVGKPLREAFPRASAELAATLGELVAAACAGGRARSIRCRGEELFGPGGDFSVHAVPLSQHLPEARALVVVEDLSEVRSLAAQLLRAEKLATVGVISAGIAHEVGTPLSVVRARAEYIGGKLGGDHPQAPGLKVIVEQIDLVTRTIRQLLDFSRARSVAPRAVNLGPLARAVAELLRFEAQRRKVSVEVDVPDSLPPLAADPDQLQQALVNLVMNACDACAEGGRVQLAARPEPGGMARVEVADDGCGIAEEHRLQVFDPFFTTKKRGQGTGLGLTVVAQIVRSHGGQVELESAPGKGTRVTLLWPAAAGEEAKDAVG